jgi:hypothetical protein
MASLLVVGGSIAANYANGGIAWERLSWALGLRRLGFEILVLDQLDRARCVHADGDAGGYETCLNREYFERVIADFGLEGSAALVGDAGEVLYGPPWLELLERVEAASMLVNIAGNVRLAEVKRRARLCVLVDVDPGLTQLRLASGETTPRLSGHDLHFTIGENVGTPASSLPTGGMRWLHTRQPVVLDAWPVTQARRDDRFTTVATLHGVGPHGGIDGLGHKADELAKVIELPRRAPGVFELALRIRDAEEDERRRLEQFGWSVVDAAAVAADPQAFRSYVLDSAAEFSIAKGAYASTRSGWFSDRTTRYLAAGKPAIVQDTGFTRSIPVGEGLFAFTTLDEAIDATRHVLSDYGRHRAAARALAERFFDSDVVLTRFLDDVDASRPAAVR